MENLTYDLIGAFHAGKNRHPQLVMKELGIKYSHATPQSVADSWWFWNCKNVPEALPKFLEISDRKPLNCVGFGLSSGIAQKLEDERVMFAEEKP